MTHLLGAIYWNPSAEAFRVPIIDHPVVWYGILFVTGFILGYFLVYSIFKQILVTSGRANPKENALYLADRLTWFAVGGTLIGARLGHVFFYDPARYLANPIEIFQTWKGGLASHGGMIGIIVALYLFYLFIRKKYQEFSFIGLIDILCIPATLAAFFIRMGNFVNQEIIGTPSNLPWAVIFGHPSDGSIPEPRHPVQLYEGFFYLFLFIFIYSLWKRLGPKLSTGTISGLVLILLNSARFILEFWKAPQHGFMQDNYLQTGQYLSLPFIALGFFLFFYGQKFSNRINFDSKIR